MVTYTSSTIYWKPSKPRIRIYAFGDTTYSSPLYTYDAFTDAGSTTKPVSLKFDSQTVNAGSFDLEIEDTTSAIDPDVFTRGNRVVIDLSKDGITYNMAFKGLVRSAEQTLYGIKGRNITLKGYSYLIRLNERVLNVKKESSLIGPDYNRTDAAMFTNNLTNDLLTNDANYAYSTNDTSLYSVLKTDNLTTSTLADWVPRLDAYLVTVNDALSSVLEFSNGLVMVDFSNDELLLYNTDNTTSATGVFLITDQINQSSDDGDITMYPTEPYKYDISYDYTDSGSRLMASIGNFGCPQQTFDVNGIDSPYDTSKVSWLNTSGSYFGCYFGAKSGVLTDFTLPVRVQGNMSASDHTNIWFSTWYTRRAQAGNSSQCAATEYFTWGMSGNTIGPYTLYRDGIPGKAYPSVSTDIIHLKLDPTTQPTLPIPLAAPSGGYSQANSCRVFQPGTGTFPGTYWNGYYTTSGGYLDSGGIFVVHHPGTQDAANRIGLIGNYPYVGMFCQTTGASSVTFALAVANGWGAYLGSTDNPSNASGKNFWRVAATVSNATIDKCAGFTSQDADPVFLTAQDKNMSARTGIVEKVVDSMPPHVKTLQTMNEYFYNKLYTASKPRFTFDYQNVTMPGKIPKAGDICCHVSGQANVGLRTSPIQTGVITSVSYDFGQGTDGVLGLRKLGLVTTGVKRGSY